MAPTGHPCARRRPRRNPLPTPAQADPSGEARFVALRPIAPGEEVTLSYIEEEGVGLEERRRALAESGFVCGCGRCTAEELAARAGGLALA